jgi:hypothetical protein
VPLTLRPRLNAHSAPVWGLVTLFFVVFGELAAQSPPSADGWNAPEALALRDLGRMARQTLVQDGSLQSYQALTEGHIYFYVDPEEGERALIRVDQVAVELFWEAPDLVRQRIVGERAETRLPVRDFRYYLDRLTLVQYGFGDEIEVGQGMDVSGVPHPLAPIPPEGNEPYDVRLGEAVEIRLPGDMRPLRIRELQVRPTDPRSPGIVGSLFLSTDDGQLVRMAFTFTPASYVDRRTDRIEVALDYGLWEGKYWLPNRQEIEVRREMPELDLEIGTVIRAVLRVGEYELNTPFPFYLRDAPRVTAAPQATREAWDFREGLFDALDRDGLGEVRTRVDPRELRTEVARRLGNRPPTGLAPARFHLPGFSSLVEADAARGVTVGMGGSLRPTGALRLRGWGGWSFGPERPTASLSLDGLAGDLWTVRLEGGLNLREDRAARPALPGVLASASTLFLGEDYRDPYRRTGFRATFARRMGGELELRATAGGERHRSESLHWLTSPWGEDREFQPIRPIEEGDFGRGELELSFRREGVGAGGWGGRSGATLTLTGNVETLVGGTRFGSGGRVGGSADLRYRSPDGKRELRARAEGGSAFAGSLPQLSRSLGGQGSVGGFPWGSRVGEDWGLAGVEGSVDLGSPWVRLRGGVELGWIPGELLVGARGGVGLVYDILRVEAARGLQGEGAAWQLQISVDPLWWSRL